MINHKNSEQIQDLKGTLLERFRTRGDRRAERYPLSPLWPQVWCPPPYINPKEECKEGQSPSAIFNFCGEDTSDLSQHYLTLKYDRRSLSIIDVESETLLLSLPSHTPWMSLSFTDVKLTEKRGFFHVESRGKASEEHFFVSEPPQSISYPSSEQVKIEGILTELNHIESAVRTPLTLKWVMHLQLVDGACDTRSLSIRVSILNADDESLHRLQPRLSIHLSASPTESIFGMGAQLTWLNLKGRVVPSWVQEPGIGRGIQPLTWFMERMFGAGGSDVQSSAPSPIYMTSSMQAHGLENYEFSTFDFSRPQLRSIEVWADELKLRVFGGDGTPQKLLKSISKMTGVMPSLPEWTQQGAIIGAQGGTEKIRELWSKLKTANVEVAAFWLQDWVGKRETSVGEQLWWDWQLDDEHYSDWASFKTELTQQRVKILGYINPYLVETSDRKSSVTHASSLFHEAFQKGYLLLDPQKKSQPLMIKNTSFSAAVVDLSMPEAFKWLKEIIKERLIKIGLSGWMADFGEALPVDAQLHQGSGLQLHNQFPVLWAQLNREVIDELAGQTDEYLFFNRSGFTHTPKYSQLTWFGDHLTSWKKYDGIYSGLVGLLSSGFSGVTLSHSDAGGYICTDPPRTFLRIPFMSHVRSQELLMRWVEMNTFSAVLRTHEGNQPNRHHQIYDDQETLAHFAKMSALFKALMPVRLQCMERVKEGIPLVAHPWIFFPNDPHCLELQEQMMLGPDLMVAPVIRKGWVTVKLYIPKGEWGHWWSSEVVVGPKWIIAAAPLGEPAIFYRLGSLSENIAMQWGAEYF
jgi:sulfoquinovosidase